MVMHVFSGGGTHRFNRHKTVTNMFDGIVDKYKSLDLKLYVVRRAHAKCFDNSEHLIKEEKQICREQDALLAQLCSLELKSHEDALKCLEIWHLETIGNRKHGSLMPTESVILQVYNYLKRVRS